MDRQAYWKWTTLVPLLAVAGVFFVSVFDPLDYDGVTKRWSAKIFYRLYAPLYPPNFRDKIAIVFLDEETLAKRQETWPPTHLVHGDVLTAIMDYEPAAVLVDLFFTEQRANDHIALTTAVIRRAEKEGVPLFFIADPYAAGADKVARPEIVKAVTSSQLVSPEADFEGGVTTQYRLLSSGALRLEPAALVVADAYCENLNGRADSEAKCVVPKPSNDLAPLEVVWGLRPSMCDRDLGDLGPENVNSFCSELSPSALGSSLQLLWSDLVSEVPVPYHAFLSTEQVLDGGLRDRLEPLLKHKIVIYSARHNLVKDRAFTPVHGSVEGAFVHAMAIDNLLNWGGRYVHMASKEGFVEKTIIELLPTLVMLCASLVVIAHRRSLIRKLPAGSESGLTPSERKLLLEEDEGFLEKFHLILILLIFAAAPVSFFLFSISPFNWFGLLICVEAVHRFGRKLFAPRATGQSHAADETYHYTG
jgi:CHASE2 domain-containing sensor protein